MTKPSSKKSAARLYALQALFQMEAAAQSSEDVRAQFLEHRFGAEDEGLEYLPGDVDLFETLLHGAVTNQAKIDQMMDQALDKAWPINRIDPTLRALFRAAGAELLSELTPPKVIINEYVELAKAFFPEGDEPKFVNGVLDKIVRTQNASLS